MDAVLSILRAIFPGERGLANFIGARDNESGGDNWSYKTCKASVKSYHQQTKHQTFYMPDALPVAHPTVSKC